MAQARNIDELCITTIRMLAVDAVEKAKSGHPGLPLGAAPMAYVLWTRFLQHNPQNPGWADRDRFILSAGHGSALLYALLHLAGYDMPIEELERFRQWGSATPGHPEVERARGIESTTGPLGQGFGMGVGMALAERFLAARYNRPGHAIVNHTTYAIVSDGDLMEGVASEAASIAGHQKLGKLVYLYDDNHISIEGSTDIAFTEDACRRFEAYGWHAQRVADGNDLDAIEAAIRAARENTSQPSLIAVRTHIGFGSPKHDDASAHGEPLGAAAMKATKEFFGWPADQPFFVPEEARQHLRQAIERGAAQERAWRERFDAYRKTFPAEAARFEREQRGELPEGWAAKLPAFDPATPMATRDASGKAINALAAVLPNLIGGSADLAPSNKTAIVEGGDAEAATPSGRNLHFGVREHGMGAIVNGMALHGGVLPFGATFFIFSDYMRPSIRLAALMQAHSIFVFTHDSIGVGEDGPTHQPVEHLMSLRAMPNLVLLRPADANETAVAWKVAVERKGPVALVLTRQKLPTLDQKKFSPASGLEKGAYVLSDCAGSPSLLLIASGSEVALALAVQERLAAEGIRARVVSMPSWRLFEEQPQSYRDAVLPPEVAARLAIEAGATFGWERWVGDAGAAIGLDRFGASAPAETLFEKFGFTVEAIVARARKLLAS
jgi:transketolase